MKAEEIFSAALETLRKGGTILYPTDTVWGLGCDATNPEAVAKIFEIKRRSEAKSLVLLASDLDMVAKYIKEIPSIAIDLVEVNDAPMTIIYPGAIVSHPNNQRLPGAPISHPNNQRLPGAPISHPNNQRLPGAPMSTPLSSGDRWHLAWNAVAEDGSVGIRIPLSEWCKQLIFKLGRPIVSTSANISGEPTPKRFTEIPAEIKEAVDFVVPPSVDKESTGKASQIIKVGLTGEIEIIRK